MGRSDLDNVSSSFNPLSSDCYFLFTVFICRVKKHASIVHIFTFRNYIVYTDFLILVVNKVKRLDNKYYWYNDVIGIKCYNM